MKINNLQVPSVIQHGASVVLDCDFTLEEKEQGLVVKWFFTHNNQTLVYQWIPGKVIISALDIERGGRIQSKIIKSRSPNEVVDLSRVVVICSMRGCLWLLFSLAFLN